MILNIGILMKFGDYQSRVMSELIGKLSFIAVIMIGIIIKRKQIEIENHKPLRKE